MRLSELLVCISLLMISVGVISGALIQGNKGILKTEINSRNVIAEIDTDLFLRSKIEELEIPYWKSLEEKIEVINQALQKEAIENGFEVLAVSFDYEREKNAELLNIEWKMNGRVYVTRQYIRQRVFDE